MLATHSRDCAVASSQECRSPTQGHTIAPRVVPVFIVADAYCIYHLIDDIEERQRFSSASDNGGGINLPAGPDATTDLSPLPPILPLAQPR
jgi:hypothetical protein